MNVVLLQLPPFYIGATCIGIDIISQDLDGMIISVA